MLPQGPIVICGETGAALLCGRRNVRLPVAGCRRARRLPEAQDHGSSSFRVLPASSLVRRRTARCCWRESTTQANPYCWAPSNKAPKGHRDNSLSSRLKKRHRSNQLAIKVGLWWSCRGQWMGSPRNASEAWGLGACRQLWEKFVRGYWPPALLRRHTTTPSSSDPSDGDAPAGAVAALSLWAQTLGRQSAKNWLTHRRKGTKRHEVGGGAYGLTNGRPSKTGIHRDIAVGRKVDHKFMHYRHRHSQCGSHCTLLSKDSLRGPWCRWRVWIKSPLRQNSKVVH